MYVPAPLPFSLFALSLFIFNRRYHKVCLHTQPVFLRQPDIFIDQPLYFPFCLPHENIIITIPQIAFYPELLLHVMIDLAHNHVP